MMTIFLLVIISQVLGYCSQSTVIKANACAMVYQGPLCTGALSRIRSNQRNGVLSRGWNNKVSSIVVNQRYNCVLEAFTNFHFRGYRRSFRGTVIMLSPYTYRYYWFFRRSWNNSISSWKCRCRGVTSGAGNSKGEASGSGGGDDKATGSGGGDDKATGSGGGGPIPYDEGPGVPTAK